MITPAASNSILHGKRLSKKQVEAEVRQQRGQISKAKGTAMSKFRTLGTHNIVEKRDTNIHEISCHLLLHHTQKPHATIFSAFHSLHLNSNEIVHNWQQWLQARVFEHPAWCTRANR